MREFGRDASAGTDAESCTLWRELDYGEIAQ
jgi:hypothetical protein